MKLATLDNGFATAGSWSSLATSSERSTPQCGQAAPPHRRHVDDQHRPAPSTVVAAKRALRREAVVELHSI